MALALVELAFQRLRPCGRVVVNVNSIHNLAAVHATAQRLTPDVHVRMLNIAHSTDQLESVHFESRSPTFLITAVKGQQPAASDAEPATGDY